MNTLRKIRDAYRRCLQRLVRRDLPSSPAETRRRVKVRITGEVGTVHEIAEPDYSLVMIDGCDRLQAYREHEITSA